METKGINANGESKAKPSRKEIIEKKKAMDALLRAASSEKDHLSAFPAFRRYRANGTFNLTAYLFCQFFHNSF
ncbi:hypothetical protein C1H46_030789 [Malus baccata]|uniref:Uncharacterized protein n=1 Tax=Malus baccata TaxID=106549 RepID=A0A540LBI1_MALBA|nr:hypothetical protein C1H46_030789 [Malus baccata]